LLRAFVTTLMFRMSAAVPLAVLLHVLDTPGVAVLTRFKYPSVDGG
jgi:hypothetical protein